MTKPTISIVAGLPPPTGDHALFDQLAARPDCIAAYSLRDNLQLLHYMDAVHKPHDITYAPENDPDPRRQDAAKVLVPAGEVSLPNNVRVPIPPIGSDSLLVTWESWLGAEFAYDPLFPISRYKHFQFASGADDNGRIWTEVRAVFYKAADAGIPGAVARLDCRTYAYKDDVAPDHPFYNTLGPNVTQKTPLSPQIAEFGILPEVWTRYWAAFEPSGEWWLFSLWLSDATRKPVLTHDRLQLKPNPNATPGEPWKMFWLEYNSSSNNPPPYARTAYCRNVVILRGVKEPEAVIGA